MKKILLSIFALYLFCSNTTYAQTPHELQLHFLTNLYQSNKVNPAFKANNKFALQIAPFSFYFNFVNTGFIIRDLNYLIKNKNNIATDPAAFLGKLDDKNYFNTNISMDLLSFRVRIRKVDVTFNATTNVNMSIGYPRGLLELPVYGPAGDIFLNSNKAVTLDGLGVNAQAYHEVGLGIAHTVLKDRLTYGVKYKYLIGIVNVSFDKSEFSLKTDNDPAKNYPIAIKTNFLVNTANVPAIRKDPKDSTLGIQQDFDYMKALTDISNKGHAIDLGVNYKIFVKGQKAWAVNASVINMGYIDWKSNAKNYSAQLDTSFSGIEYKLNNENNNQDLQKQYTKAIRLDSTSKSFRTYLSPTMYLGSTYNFNDKNKVGVLVAANYFNFKGTDILNVSNYRYAFTAGYTKTFGRAWDVGVTYSIANRNYLNVGFGSALRFLCFETYFVTDNIMTFLYPATTNSINFRFGANLIFGRLPMKDRDKDGIPDKYDLCKKIPGSPTTKGCPDTDKDSIPDNQDSCALVYGLKKFNGCPDSDNDGVADRLDRCPNDSGSIFLKGCPDKDNDSIPDLDDRCPDLKGLMAYQGCPDKDNDSIPDIDDKCPDLKGLKLYSGCPDSDNDSIADPDDACPTAKGQRRFNGCPDSDNDSIIDSKDECPDKAGLLINFGCPDTDNDSIPDSRDKCPTEAGPRANNGCPNPAEPVKAQLSKEEEEVVNKVFSNLEFEAGKAKIKETSYPALDALYDVLTKKPKFTLAIAGHTDKSGSAKANMKLSKQRAESVKKYIVDKGIDKDRVKAEGFGSTKPIADNKTPEGRAKNRRVEFTILE